MTSSLYLAGRHRYGMFFVNGISFLLAPDTGSGGFAVSFSEKYGVFFSPLPTGNIVLIQRFRLARPTRVRAHHLPSLRSIRLFPPTHYAIYSALYLTKE